MANIEMYTTRICPWCVRAKRLLNSKGVPDDDITEINVDLDRSVMMERTGGRTTVPQIYINGTHVGGFDDLAALDASGALNDMLGDDS